MPVHDTEAHRKMTPAQHACLDLRRLLRDLGVDDARLRMITPRGDAHVHIPALPVAVVQHLVNLLPAPPDGRRHP